MLQLSALRAVRDAAAQLSPFELRRNPPANAALRRALTKLASEPSVAHRVALHPLLTAGPLLVALRELPRNLGGDPRALAGELPIRFVTHEGANGTCLLAAFTGVDAVAARAPAGVWLAVAPLAVLGWIAEECLDGLILDPDGPAAVVTRDEVLAILGYESSERAAPQAHPVGAESETELREALGKLLSGEARLSFLVVKERRTGKFVRFTPDPNGALMLDIPVKSLSGDELQRANLLFEELSGGAERLPDPVERPDGEPAPEPAHLLALFSGDVGYAAKAAFKIFTWVFGFPDGVELSIEEH